MFVPEVYILKWIDFEPILRKAKIRLYHFTYSYRWILELQVFDGIAVYTHEEPEHDGGTDLILGYPLSSEDLKVLEHKNPYPNYTKRDSLDRNYSISWKDEEYFRSEWFRGKLQRTVDRILKPYYKVIEGEFVSLVRVAEPENRDVM
jgi:hypothetical protein